MEAPKPHVDVDVDLLADFRTALEERDGHGADQLAGRLSTLRRDWAPGKPELLTLIRLLRKSDPERCVKRMRSKIAATAP